MISHPPDPTSDTKMGYWSCNWASLWAFFCPRFRHPFRRVKIRHTTLKRASISKLTNRLSPVLSPSTHRNPFSLQPKFTCHPPCLSGDTKMGYSSCNWASLWAFFCPRFRHPFRRVKIGQVTIKRSVFPPQNHRGIFVGSFNTPESVHFAVKIVYPLT